MHGSFGSETGAHHDAQAPRRPDTLARPVAVFGGQGGGALAAFILRRIEASTGNARFAGYLNDTAAAGSSIGTGLVLGRFDSWASLPPDTHFLAPLHKAKEMERRAQRIVALGIEASRWATVIDPDAIVADDVTHAPGLFVAGHVSIGPAVRIGAHVAIRPGAYIGHDASLEDFVFVGGNAVIAGYASLGKGAHVAPGATIRDGTRIGRFAVVGLGAVVVRDVPEYAVVMGNPARRIGSIEPVESAEGDHALDPACRS